MDTSDELFDIALLYLHAAGHDTGPETRARLNRILQAQEAQHPALGARGLLEQIPRWFRLPAPAQIRSLPPITRASIRYPRE